MVEIGVEAAEEAGSLQVLGGRKNAGVPAQNQSGTNVMRTNPVIPTNTDKPSEMAFFSLYKKNTPYELPLWNGQFIGVFFGKFSAYTGLS